MYLWCRFPSNADRQQLQILYIGLYFLIWGEASNIRFMPECLCFIFHNVGNSGLYRLFLCLWSKCFILILFRRCFQERKKKYLIFFNFYYPATYDYSSFREHKFNFILRSSQVVPYPVSKYGSFCSHYWCRIIVNTLYIT